MFAAYSLNRLLAIVVALGSLFLMIETMIEHWGVLSQEPVAFIPITGGLFGFLVAAVTIIRWNEKSIRVLHYLLLGFLVVSIGGLYFHIAEEDEADMTEETREHESKEKEKPLLAPLSFAGLAVVGLLGTSRRWPAEVV